jgi:hypothetical protein
LALGLNADEYQTVKNVARKAGHQEREN